VEDPDFDKLKEKAKEFWLRALITTAYTFGFRKSELVNLRAGQVNLIDRTIKLNPGETKNDEARTVVMTSDVLALVTICVQGKSASDFVFSRRDGEGIGDFRKLWAGLCKQAGLGGLLFHDLRRSAVRNMVRRGIPETVAMRISGHKTRSVFDRYNVTSEKHLADAALKIEQG
jgi:integrase